MNFEGLRMTNLAFDALNVVLFGLFPVGIRQAEG